MIPIWVGYDEREAAAFHVFCQSVIDHATEPVSLHPLTVKGFDGQRDGTNAFIFSRYLIPHLQNFSGWALFADGDMVVLDDVANLMALRDESKAVMVVKHDYQTSSRRKYIGSPLENDNVDYPRKNWSSVVLWNCGHKSNRILSRDFVTEAGGKFLHRFEWLNDDEIGELPVEWNSLEGESPNVRNAKLIHYTLGVPGFKYYADTPKSSHWHKALMRTLHVAGEAPVDMVKRASSY